MHWDGEGRSFERRGWGRWVLEKGERREGSRGEREGGGGGPRTIFSRRTMHENGRRRGGQRLENGAERLALVVRGACGFEDASIGGDETLEHRTIVSVVIRLGKSQGVPWLRAPGRQGRRSPPDDGWWTARYRRQTRVDRLHQAARLLDMKRRSGCEAGVDRHSVAADAPCHAASFLEWSWIGDGTCRPVVEGGREKAM